MMVHMTVKEQIEKLQGLTQKQLDRLYYGFRQKCREILLANGHEEEEEEGEEGD